MVRGIQHRLSKCGTLGVCHQIGGRKVSKQMSTEWVAPASNAIAEANEIVASDAHAEEIRTLESRVEYYRDLCRMKDRAVQADDDRVRPLLQEMYDVLVSHHEGHIWEHFVDDLSDFPNLAVRNFVVNFQMSVDVEVEATDEEDAEEKAVEKLEEDYTVKDLAIDADATTTEV